jgi:hypothetical protein
LIPQTRRCRGARRARRGAGRREDVLVPTDVWRIEGDFHTVIFVADQSSLSVPRALQCFLAFSIETASNSVHAVNLLCINLAAKIGPYRMRDFRWPQMRRRLVLRSHHQLRLLACGSFMIVCIFVSTSLALAPPFSRGERAPSRYPGSKLTTVNGQAVFGSLLNKQTPTAVCPRRPLRVSGSDIKHAAIVVGRALPAMLAHAPGRARVDPTGAKTTGIRATKAHSGETFRPFCGQTVWARSVFAIARLPRVKHSASLSELSFLMAKIAEGWIIWGEVH